MNSRILPFLSFLVALGIIFAFVGPTWNGAVARARAQIARDNDALAAARSFSERQNELASARNAIDPADLANLAAFLPDSVDNVGLILDLNALAARTGLALSSVDVGGGAGASGGARGASNPANASVLPAAGASPLGSVDLSLSAVGTYAALRGFLDGVEKSRRLLDVRDLVVKGSDTGVYSYQMTLRLYWLR